LARGRFEELKAWEVGPDLAIGDKTVTGAVSAASGREPNSPPIILSSCLNSPGSGLHP
jgi:hypothetical protein